MNNLLPDHLGGHLNKTHTDRGTLNYLIRIFGIQSMLDIGCGPGDMVQIAQDRGIDVMGVDGDYSLAGVWAEKNIPVVCCDLSEGTPTIDRKFDLAWSVEFLEHVEEKYQDNYMKLFEKCNYVVCTAAPPGYPGHHHVNCRDQDYWIGVFGRYGFVFSPDITAAIRRESTMQKPFLARTGMFFLR